MQQTRALVETLKTTLREQKITYAQVAKHLELSEASVKRLFASCNLTVHRLEQICDLAQISLLELTERQQQRPQPLSRLTPEQEEELLADPKLLLATFMTLNDWQVEQIVATFDITEAELIQRLARLDHLRIIELLPGNRVRRLVARNFTWRKNGPVQAYFEQSVKQQFLNSRFSRDADHLRFVGGRLSEASLTRMHQAIDRLTVEFDELVKTDSTIDHDLKKGVGAVFAIRPWELPAFSKLRRTDTP
ncbi:MAG: helix-turn-helix domain-containing protein [Lysobacterales bacterium]